MKITEHFSALNIGGFQFDPDSPGFVHHHFAGPSNTDRLRAHDFFVFLLFEKGAGFHSIDFVDYPVRPRQIHMLFPGQLHKWDLDESTSGHKLVISKEIFETFSAPLQFSFVRYRNHPVIDLELNAFLNILSEFVQIRKELDNEPVFEKVVHLRSRLITTTVDQQAKRMFEDVTFYQANPILYKFHTLIDEFFKEQKTVMFYADRLNISANYLSILCKREFRVSASYFIQKRVILEAKRLIQSSEKSIKEIAFELGFTDLPYFSHFFKSGTGLSPRQFKTVCAPVKKSPATSMA